MTEVGPAQHFQAQLCLLEATPIVFLESLNVLTISKLATRGLGSLGWVSPGLSSSREQTLGDAASSGSRDLSGLQSPCLKTETER